MMEHSLTFFYVPVYICSSSKRNCGLLPHRHVAVLPQVLEQQQVRLEKCCSSRHLHRNPPQGICILHDRCGPIRYLNLDLICNKLVSLPGPGQRADAIRGALEDRRRPPPHQQRLRAWEHHRAPAAAPAHPRGIYFGQDFVISLSFACRSGHVTSARTIAPDPAR